ncbi:MAG: thiamine diphosphokinase [Acidimicrobiia bacterium]|nr:thiamine diphosphokinase [Acidimicrobiia bacterium]MYB74161.1 thiamine diphosphokinase [Acidimicrobiia bacterium]MYH98080.1 thiamine diphosphokinase [Acidimicrobiia bacterium]
MTSPPEPGVTVVVVAGGDPPTPEEIACLPADPVVVAADSGLDYAQAAGLTVAVAVGDMDSVSPEALAAAEQAGTRIERHPADKDQTDLELALELAARLADRVIVIGAGGGRLDHLIGNLAVLASPQWSGVDIEAWLGNAQAVVVHHHRVLDVEPDTTVSLFALGGPARVTTTGLAWPLNEEILDPLTSRGVSNRATDPSPSVSVSKGVVLAVIS